MLRLPRTEKQGREAGRRLWGVTVVLALALGCATKAPRAPFFARPDTVLDGDVRGPFDGTVLEGEGDRPVPGVLVCGTWSFMDGKGAPAGSFTFVAETDAGGNYALPRLSRFPKGAASISSFTLVLYKRGFVSYRSDRHISDGAPRLDFAQQRNEVHLQRLQRNLSHRRHLAFLSAGGAGGPPALRDASAWELELASAELLSPSAIAHRKAATTMRLLDAGRLLSIEEIKRATNAKGNLEVFRLDEDLRSASQDALGFVLRAPGEGEGKGEAALPPQDADAGAPTMHLSLRVWKSSSQREAHTQFTSVAKALPAPVPTADAGTRAMRAEREDTHIVAFFDGPRGLVVELACHKSLCADADVAASLAAIVSSHAKEVSP